MFVFAALLAMLLVAFVMSLQPVAYVMLIAAMVALLIHWRRRSKGKAARPWMLAGGVLLAGSATLIISMYMMIHAELSPTREIMVKTKEIENILSQADLDGRFATAMKIVHSGTSDTIRRRLGETMLDVFRGADYRKERVGASDLQTIETLLRQLFPRPAGVRSCSVYFAHLYVRQTGPADVHQVLSEYPDTVADCGGSVEYLMLVRRRCARSGEWYAQCSAQLPQQQLMALRNEPSSAPGVRQALDTLLNEVYGRTN
ncbi:hypothetical protein [Dokdonella immobilis]|uniref:Uncharacterized protein n=1 Tax=Dokdonella immobilis TaxID=578942 RepID=A0A1I4V0U8_9GAMM|nr:hypothetical protein [Dokdonella immobilis]SFM94781.1 hypothetical protein SAMN05216289_1015 [Dokdonella immobilis]